MIVTDEQKRIELMHTIDRFVAIIKPKQPFLDWLESLPDWDLDMTLEKLREDSNAYLVPEYDSTEQAMRYIERNHKAIFEWELWSWYTDETSWPEKLTPSVSLNGLTLRYTKWSLICWVSISCEKNSKFPLTMK